MVFTRYKEGHVSRFQFENMLFFIFCSVFFFFLFSNEPSVLAPLSISHDRFMLKNIIFYLCIYLLHVIKHLSRTCFPWVNMFFERWNKNIFSYFICSWLADKRTFLLWRVVLKSGDCSFWKMFVLLFWRSLLFCFKIIYFVHAYQLVCLAQSLTYCSWPETSPLFDVKFKKISQLPSRVEFPHVCFPHWRILTLFWSRYRFCFYRNIYIHVVWHFGL